MKLTSVGFIFIVETVRIFVLSKSAVCRGLLQEKEPDSLKFVGIIGYTGIKMRNG